ncbi:MAG: SAM-dependent methyltransferase [Polyangiales bacterium]
MTFDAVARTAWLTARLRAEETARPSPLFRDPFAARLVDALGAPDDDLAGVTSGPSVELVESFDAWRALSQRDPRAASGVARAAALAVRSRYFDDALLAAVARGARTVVILAAGLDARVYRLSLPAGLRWIEVDRPEVLAHKRSILADAAPHAELLDVGGDLREPAVLDTVTRALRGPSFWLVEGLLMYLQPREVDALLDTVAAQLLAGSSVAFDVPNRAYVDPRGPVSAHLARHAARGSPWTFATDAPAALVESRGLVGDVVHVGHPRAHYGRLPWPATETPMPGVPTSFLVTGRCE